MLIFIFYYTSPYYRLYIIISKRSGYLLKLLRIGKLKRLTINLYLFRIIRLWRGGICRNFAAV